MYIIRCCNKDIKTWAKLQRCPECLTMYDNGAPIGKLKLPEIVMYHREDDNDTLDNGFTRKGVHAVIFEREKKIFNDYKNGFSLKSIVKKYSSDFKTIKSIIGKYK